MIPDKEDHGLGGPDELDVIPLVDLEAADSTALVPVDAPVAVAHAIPSVTETLARLSKLKTLTEEELALFYLQLHSLLSRFHTYARAFPSSNISRFRIFDSGLEKCDTAYWRMDDKTLNIALTFLQAIEFDIVGIEAVVGHETGHSSFTTSWMEAKQLHGIRSLLLNHLEDWRLNTFLVRNFPHLRQGFDVVYTAAFKSGSRQFTVTENKQQFVLWLWHEISRHSYYPNFETQVEFILNRPAFTDEQRELLARIKPHILGFQRCQPDFYNRDIIRAQSKEAVAHAQRIFEILEEEKVFPATITPEQFLKLLKDLITERKKGDVKKDEPKKDEPAKKAEDKADAPPPKAEADKPAAAPKPAGETPEKGDKPDEAPKKDDSKPGEKDSAPKDSKTGEPETADSKKEDGAKKPGDDSKAEPDESGADSKDDKPADKKGEGETADDKSGEPDAKEEGDGAPKPEAGKDGEPAESPGEGDEGEGDSPGEGKAEGSGAGKGKPGAAGKPGAGGEPGGACDQPSSKPSDKADSSDGAESSAPGTPAPSEGTPKSGEAAGESTDDKGTPSPNPLTPPEKETWDNLDTLSTEELEAMKEAMERMAGADTPKPADAKEETEGELRQALKDAEARDSAKTEDSEGKLDPFKDTVKITTAANAGGETPYGSFAGYVDPVDVKYYDDYIIKWRSTVARLVRLFANAKSEASFEQGHKMRARALGNRLRIKAVVRRLANPGLTESKIFNAREGELTRGHAVMNFEDVLMGIDSSGSMAGTIGVAQTMAGLIYLALQRNKTRCAIASTIRDRPYLICKGNKLERPEPVIRRLGGLVGAGDVDMANGSIQVLHSLQRPGANPTKSRLAIFSDCCAVERDMVGVATTAKKIGYPICVVAITGGSYALGAKKYMPNASFIQTSGQTSPESVWKVMQVFSKWMADPVTFYRSIQKTGGIYQV